MAKAKTTESVKPRYERKCANCGHDFGREGGLPYEAALHYEAGEWSVTCGNRCRAVLKRGSHRV